ncbi:toll/interleukin-1 receptor domain-containing protein [Aeromonas jandaei]|uniref:toll/interleukin-1 receptor domain-containing protein n=1 Tax=Aeromonas jandaei TaxID=650 RepID=UPI003BA2BC7B
MQIFLSWSGPRSYAIADALRNWLPKVIQSVRPWMSSEDISAGSRWLTEVSNKLDESRIGIICVTPENLSSPWLHFEAGALSKVLEQSRVCPLAFELTPGQISGPLSQFQSVTLDQAGVRKILFALNSELGERALQSTELDEIQSVWWPNLEAKIAAIPKSSEPIKTRDINDQLEELLQLSREQLRRENLRLESYQNRDVKIDKMIQHMDKAMSSLIPIKQMANDNRRDANSMLEKALASLNTLKIDYKDIPSTLLEAFKSDAESIESVDVDIQSLTNMTNVLRQLQQEDKTNINKILTPPSDEEKKQ